MAKAPAVNMTLAGDKALVAKLDALPKVIHNKAVKKASRSLCRRIESIAKATVPTRKKMLRDGSMKAYKSGQLKKAIRWKAMKRSRVRQGHVVMVGKGWFRGDTFYGAFIELGTEKMRPRPFLRPAATAVRGRIRPEYTEALNDAIRHVSKQKIKNATKTRSVNVTGTATRGMNDLSDLFGSIDTTQV